MNEKQKYEIIKELARHNGNKNRAAMKLNLSRRQINRLIIKYKETGKSAFIHSKRLRKSVNHFKKSISNKIRTVYQKNTMFFILVFFQNI